MTDERPVEERGQLGQAADRQHSTAVSSSGAVAVQFFTLCGRFAACFAKSQILPKPVTRVHGIGPVIPSERRQQLVLHGNA